MNYKNEIIDTQYSGGGAHHQNNVNVNANANANSNDNINNNHNHNATTVPSSPRQGKRKNKVIVATLSGKEKPLNPYTSLSPSPHGQIVLIGNKETIKFVSIEPSGLKEEKTVQISQYFTATRSYGLNKNNDHYNTTSNSTTAGRPTSGRLTSGRPTSANIGSNNNKDVFIPTSTPGPNENFSIIDVAWSAQVEQSDMDEVNNNIINNSNNNNDTKEFAPVRKNSAGQINNVYNKKNNKEKPARSINKIHKDDGGADTNSKMNPSQTEDTFIAVAGSNGLVVVWRERDILGRQMTQNTQYFTQHPFQPQAQKQQQRHSQYSNLNFVRSNSTKIVGQPEVIIAEHSKAVNCIAWNQRRPGVFLTASQDGTVKLFEREETTIDIASDENNTKSWNPWFPKVSSPSTVKSYSWNYTANFKANHGAIKEIKWSPFHDDIFAMVTSQGFLVIYNMQWKDWGKQMLITAAHANEALTLDWHPSKPLIIATGGVDKTVKVWEINNDSMTQHANSMSSFRSISNNGSMSSVEFISPSPPSPSTPQENVNFMDFSFHGSGRLLGPNNQYKVRVQKIQLQHELSISAQVRKLRWRPPPKKGDKSYEHRATMLAVSTFSTGGLDGGHGSVSLWSYQRQFMPLSTVDGHDGPVFDFLWLDTPTDFKDSDKMKDTWQHILSIGNDKKILVQSLAQGERPLSNIPPSVFAIANLSPYQHGYGSLQIISVHQSVPSGYNNDYNLCGLRLDGKNGFYGEEKPSDDLLTVNKFQWEQHSDNSHDDAYLNFFATDCGDLNDLYTGSTEVAAPPDMKDVAIAPEVLHLSRFAKNYKLSIDKDCPSKAAVCRYNGSVAKYLHCKGHARMWNILASILEGSDIDKKMSDKLPHISDDAMAFILYPTLKYLLLERADAGDVQTCVVLCEVLDVVVKQKKDKSMVVVPGLNEMLVRQWYLSYIDILEQMCLFSNAAYLIKHCNDPKIQKLSTLSTTMHEACPTCGKPLPVGEKTCSRCRKKVGFCFICHESVNGIFVSCSGCGHGGCLDHAVDWFNNTDNPFRQFCPTGCGHKCNLALAPKCSHFPLSTSLHRLRSPI